MKYKLSLAYKFLTFIVLGIGLFLNLRIDGSGKSFLYFTILSNLCCFLLYLVCFILKGLNKLKKNNFYYICKGAVTMCITITMVVYWAMHFTSDGIPMYANHMTACRFVHLYAPLFVMFDYVMFGEKGNLKPYYPFIWTSCLIVYGVLIMIYSSLGGTFLNGDKYIYSYMDYEKYGVTKVIITNLIMLLCYTGYGSLVQNIDYILSKKKKSKDSSK